MRHLAALLMTFAVAVTATASIQNTIRRNLSVAEGGKLVVDVDFGTIDASRSNSPFSSGETTKVVALFASWPRGRDMVVHVLSKPCTRKL